MVSRSFSRGFQPSSLRIRSARATRAGGSPARRGSSLTVSGLAGHPLHAVDDLAHAVAVAVADVECGRGAPATQVGEGVQVRRGQVLDMDVVTHAGAITGRVVGAEH